MRRLALIGNWKMYTTPSSARSLALGLVERLGSIKDADIVVSPPATSLAGVGEVIANTNIALCAQNAHWDDEGAYTGEISVKSLAELGCEYVIVGHSERRVIFKESDEMIGKRLVKVTASGLTGILCVGEKEEEREEGKTEEVLAKQMEIALSGVQKLSIIVAYEPVWAIGTGKRAEIKDIEASHRFIRKKILNRFGKDADNIRVIYGGSVKPENITELVSCEEVDGALIGGASLSIDSFTEIVTRAIERRIA